MAEIRKADPPEDWPERFLKEYSKTGNISHSARRARVTRQGVANKKLSDEVFAAAMDEAKEQANGALEVEALRRATTGTLRPVFYQGVKKGSIREFSDTLLIVLLKANMPEKYRDNARIEHTGANGGPIQVMDFDSCDDAELARRMAEASQLTAPGDVPAET